MNIDLGPALETLRRGVPDLSGVYLFGSHAAAADRADSDVDLAVLAAQPIPKATLRELAHRLAQTLRREVDLVDLGSAPTILQAQIIQTGDLVECADRIAVGLFELRALHEYRDFKMRRAGIEADLAMRGRVHAR